MTDVCIQPVDPASPAVAELFALTEAYQLALYPPESVHMAPPTAFSQPGAVFLGAFVGDRLMGCGGYIDHGDYGELKRMFVRSEARGLGIGYRLLTALEAHAVTAGLPLLRLETGIHQPEAIRLYERAGYIRRGPFGDYDDDPLSVFMEKRLDPAR